MPKPDYLTKPSVSDLARWQEQMLADSMAWHEANGAFTRKALASERTYTEALRAAFRAGHAQGWRAAIASLKLHGAL